MIRWLDTRHSEAPFFALVHYFDPHWPYRPPAPYDELFDPDYEGSIVGSVDDVMGRRAEGYSVRTHQHHFFWYADTEEVELYDVINDPRGENNLRDELPELVLGFKNAVAEWRESIGMTERIDIYE